MGKKFSDLERASSLNNGDLFAVAQVDAQAQTGYKSKSTETSTVAQKLLKGIEFPTDLETDDKTVLGAINEVNSRTIAFDVVSGPVANFKTSLELPIKSLGIDVNAVQSAGIPTPASPLPIEGWSEMKIARTGKNLFDNQFPNISTSAKYRQIKVKNGTYIASTDCPRNSDSQANLWVLEGYKTTGASTASNGLWDGRERALTITDGYITVAYREREEIANPANHRTQIELGSTATDYEPYNGTTEVINLGGTYYGGHFTQDKEGHRQFDDTISDLVNLSDLSFNPTTKGDHTCFYADLPNGVIKSGGEQVFSGKCSTYTVTSNLILPNDLSCVFYCSELYGGYTRILIRDDSASAMTGAQFTAYVTGQITYEKANPQTIALPDGEPISTLLGTNNIYADSGDASAEYALTIKDYIDKEIASVQALILNS